MCHATNVGYTADQPISICHMISHPPSLWPATRVAKQQAQAGKLQSKQNGR